MTASEGIDWERVGAAVARRRRQLGFIRQEEAAEAARLGVQTWRQVEGAKQTEYRHTTLAAIAVALRWPPDMLERIGRGEDPPDEDTRDTEIRLTALEDGLARIEERIERLTRTVDLLLRPPSQQ